MHAIRQKCRPKHQVLILKCYPRTTKGAVDIKPNSSELSYLLYYATTRRSKVQKVGAFLEKKTASDVWRARIGNVQVTLQILAALIEKAPRDLPLYAPYVLKILNTILRSRDITMVEASIPTFEAFCEHSDSASLSADQEYLQQYENIVSIYASFASTQSHVTKTSTSAPVAMRWRNAGLLAIKSVASSEALASVAGRQLSVIVPILLENLWKDNENFIDSLGSRAQLEEKIDSERPLHRRTSIATVRTVETATAANPAALSGTTADADKFAEEDIAVLAIQCLKQLFEVNNRGQIREATLAMLHFIAARVDKEETVAEKHPSWDISRVWATRMFEMVARWTPLQDRYVILITAMDQLVRSPLVEHKLQQQLVLATMIDSLLKSDINLIGLSVMDILLSLIQHVLKALQLDGQRVHETNNESGTHSSFYNNSGAVAEVSLVPTDLRKDLLAALQECIGDLATHVYYADQVSDMITAILLRLKPSPQSGVPDSISAIENPAAANAAITSAGDVSEDPNTDGFFSFDTAKVKALQAIKSILLVAGRKKKMTAGGSLGRNRVSVRVWEGTQWLLRDGEGRVRKAYVDALLTWMDLELTKSDLRLADEKPDVTTFKNPRNDSTTSLVKRAVSTTSHRDRNTRSPRNTFLQLLHLAAYENALQYVESEADIVLLYLLLANLVEGLGINAVRYGLPMIFRLQEDILEAETPLAKIHLGSLCHGYFSTVSEKFEFDSSPAGRLIEEEIVRRQGKSFWINKIRQPPIDIEQISTPGLQTHMQQLPLQKIESEALKPFDARFQMVKLISLSYAESIRSSAASPPTSPGRNFTHPILSSGAVGLETEQVTPEIVKDQMMSEWSRDSVIAAIQESTKTVSLNGSRAGTNNTGNRNFLAVNGTPSAGGMNSGAQSPQGIHNLNMDQRSTRNSNSGLGGFGTIQKIRMATGGSPSPASESSRNSITRIDHLKRILAGQESAPGASHSDADSESMVSYNYTASEISVDPGSQNGSPVQRSVSNRQPNDSARSKSQERPMTAAKHSNPLSSHPLQTTADPSEYQDSAHDREEIPPVPPLPASLVGEGTAVHDYVQPEVGKSRNMRQSSRHGGAPVSGVTRDETASASIELETLLKGIDTEKVEQLGNLTKPPY